MNKEILFVIFCAVAMPIVYFMYLEGFDPDDLREVPREFIAQTRDIVSPEKKSEVVLESENVLEFLENLPEAQDDGPRNTASQDVVETATYEVVLDMYWSEGTHGGYFPEDAHVSPFIVWTHTGRNRLFAPGEEASLGLEKMAELGGSVTLEKEIQKEIIQKSIATYVISDRIDVPGVGREMISVPKTHASITMVAMIAPSPDWFLAINEVDLVDDNGEFIESARIPFTLYDAGTEDGTGFSFKNKPTSPLGVISRLEVIPVSLLPPFGEVRLNKI